MVSIWFCLGKAKILLCSTTGVLAMWSSGFFGGCLLVPSMFKNMSLWTHLKWKNLVVVMEISKENECHFSSVF